MITGTKVSSNQSVIQQINYIREEQKFFPFLMNKYRKFKMKAKFILENIGFKRGIEPKYSMDLGGEPDLISRTDNRTVFSFLGSTYVINNILNSNWIIIGWKLYYFSPGIYNAEDLTLAKEIGKWTLKDAPAYKKIKNRIVEYGKLHENMSFKRGLNPKDAMRIGDYKLFDLGRLILDKIKSKKIIVHYDMSKDFPEYQYGSYSTNDAHAELAYCIEDIYNLDLDKEDDDTVDKYLELLDKNKIIYLEW